MSRAKSTVDGVVTGEIGQGVLVLLGVKDSDTENDARYLADKIANLRIFEDAAGKMNASLLDMGGGMLVVSQFTLFGDVRKGRRPSFIDAARPDAADKLYSAFVEFARKSVSNVQTGRFRAMMAIELVNDGPVTILIDSEKTF